MANHPTHPADDDEERLPDELAEYEAIIETVIKKAESGLDPEKALESLIAQVPEHLREKLRKVVRKRLEAMRQAIAARDQQKERRVLGPLADMFAELASRIRQKINPLELEEVRKIGAKLTAAGISMNSIEEVGPEQAGQLAPPQAGKAQKDTGISGPGGA